MSGDGKNGPILVTGGAGFCGRHLVSKLASSGHVVVSMYHYRLPPSVDRVYPVCIDLKNPDLLASPLRGVRTVVHLAWQPKGMSVGESEGLPNLTYFHNLLEKCERESVRRLVLLSVVSATASGPNQLSREKYLIEKALVNSSISEKVIVRAGPVFGGPEDPGTLVDSVRAYTRAAMVCPLPKSEVCISPVFVDDLTCVLKKFATNSISHGARIIEVTGPDSLSIGELFSIVGKYYRVNRNVFITGSLSRPVRLLYRKLVPIEAQNYLQSYLKPRVGCGYPPLDHLAGSQLGSLASIYSGRCRTLGR